MTDAIYGLRLLRAKPGHAALTILTIALGVGAVTTLFSVAYGVLLRPLPWGNTEGLVRVTETRGGREGRMPGTMMNGSYLAWADAPTDHRRRSAHFATTPMTLTGARRGHAADRFAPSRLRRFALLDARPDRGRIFTPHEGERGRTSRRDPVAWLLGTTLRRARTSSGSRS